MANPPVVISSIKAFRSEIDASVNAAVERIDAAADRIEARLGGLNVHVASLDELVRLLGGISATGEALGAAPQQVQAWMRRGYIASKHLLKHQEALKARGIVAEVRLWFRPESDASAPESEAEGVAA